VRRLRRAAQCSESGRWRAAGSAARGAGEQWSNVRGGEHMQRRASESGAEGQRGASMQARSAKGWCALDEGKQKQKQATATAAVQRLADTPRKLLHTPTKNTFFCLLHQTQMVVKPGRLRVDTSCVCLGGQ